MGVLQHNSIGSILNQSDWEGTTTHLIGGEPNTNIVRSYTYVVAGANTSAQVRAQADAVCDGVNDEVELLASISSAGQTNASVRWMGDFSLGSDLNIPALQDYLIEARETTISNDGGQLVFNSFMNANLLFGVIATPITFKPIDDSEILGAATAYEEIASYFYAAAVLGSGSTPAITFDVTTTGKAIDRCIFEFIEVHGNGTATGIYVPNPVGTGCFYSNRINMHWFHDGDIALQIGDSDTNLIYGNEWNLGFMRPNNNGTTIKCYANSSPKEVIHCARLGGTNVTGLVTGSTVPIMKGQMFEGMGTATLLNGQASVVFAHGLKSTPNHVSISWKEDPSNAIGDWWWSADETNITLNGVDPGASNLDFSWEAKV